MKKLVFGVILIVGMVALGFSQETNLYTFFVNIVSDEVNYPLVGFVNIANGNHRSFHLGFVNYNASDFTGLQSGFVNTIGGNLSGAQLGFVNITMKQLNGFQLGFVNYVDSAENGVPIGFISIVRKGGYKAVEYSFSEFHSINAGFKIGVERFYSTIIVSYNPVGEFSRENFATGLGFGSLIPISSSFFFNPELNFLSSYLGETNHNFTSFVPYVGYKISENWSVTLGPSVTWVSSNKADSYKKPLFNIGRFDINDNNGIVFGARASVRFRF